MKKYFCIFYFCVFAFFSCEGKERNSLVVGTASGYAPYVSLTSYGEYEGFDIDIAKALADKLDLTLQLKDLGSMPSLMIALQQGKVDILLWAISITKARQEKMEMIYYQGSQEMQMPFLFWKTIPKNLKNIEGLALYAKKPIAVETGSWQEEVLKKFSGIPLQGLSSVTEALLSLKYGKSFAIAIDPSLVQKVQENNQDIKVLFLPLPLEEQSFGNGICLVKSNKELAVRVKNAIEELRKEGKIDELERKWNLQSKGAGNE